MSRTHYYYAAIAVAMLGTGFFTGRITAPVQKQIVTVDREMTTEARGVRVVSISTVGYEIVTRTKQVTKWRVKPDGEEEGECTVVFEGVHRGGGTSKEDTAEENSKTSARESYHTETPSVLRPRWSLGAMAGIGLDGASRWAAIGQLRLIGGVHLVTVATTDRTAYLGLSLAW
jgi:hypothetical protein